MKKIIILVFINCLIFLNNTLSEEVLKIREGNIDAKIEIIIYESLTCGFCANFHNEIYPKLKKSLVLIIMKKLMNHLILIQMREKKELLLNTKN